MISLFQFALLSLVAICWRYLSIFNAFQGLAAQMPAAALVEPGNLLNSLTKFFYFLEHLSSFFSRLQIWYTLIHSLSFCENLMDLNQARLHEPTLNLHAHVWIFSPLWIASVAGKQHLSEVMCSALIGFSLQGKWLNNYSSTTASNFARKWATARWKPFGRFRQLSVTMLWASHRLRSGTTGLKTAAQWWRVSHAPVGHQHAKMIRSLRK